MSLIMYITDKNLQRLPKALYLTTLFKRIH